MDYNFKITILDRYIIRKFIGTFFFALLLIIVIVIIFDISEHIADFVDNHAPLKEIAFKYYGNFIPKFVNMFSPMFVFIAVIFFTSKLASNSEIVAILAGGISFKRLMYPYFISATVIALFSLVLNLFLIPPANKGRQEFQSKYIKTKFENTNRDMHYQMSPGNFLYVESFSVWNKTAYRFTLETIEDHRLVFPHLHMGRDEVAVLKILNPYVRWALENGMTTITLGDERRRLEKQRYVYERHIADNKRRNLEKKACLAIVNGIYPYIDRLANEADKLTRKGLVGQAEIRVEKYQYMDELVTTINEYNDILALWIKMKQGALSLHIENFELDELFVLLGKGRRVFEMRRLTFEVMPTDACVKADRALTLFMLNTLVENARKYTPEGGSVKVYAESREDYVEISVEDTGRGLSKEDVICLTEEKIYDPKAIGMNDADDREELKKSKGSGFGLMNCKGIIEKYRKTNALFGVCKFGVESELGRGSRFYFRLPVGVRKALMLLVLVLSAGLASCGGGKVQTEGRSTDLTVDSSSVAVQDSLAQIDGGAYDELLLWASDYANAAYYSNIDREYEQTLAYVDSAMWCLNEHADRYGDGRVDVPMTLEGEGSAAELQWWNAA